MDHDVLGRSQLDLGSGLGTQRDAAAPHELLAVRRVIGEYVYIGLDECLFVDQVEARSLANGTVDRFSDNVKVGFNRGDERIDTLKIKIRHKVDFERRRRALS